MAEPVGRVFEGSSGQLRDSPWLTWEDLPLGRDVQVTVEHVKLYDDVEFEAGRVKKLMGTLSFVGRERELGLNATNRKVMAKMFGNMTKGWAGQVITLYVTTTKLKGLTVNCVRIRDTAGGVQSSPVPRSGSLEKAVEAAPPVDQTSKSRAAFFAKATDAHRAGKLAADFFDPGETGQQVRRDMLGHMLQADVDPKTMTADQWRLARKALESL